jgi:hypothetical protein
MITLSSACVFLFYSFPLLLKLSAVLVQKGSYAAMLNGKKLIQ